MCWWYRCTRRVQFPNSDVDQPPGVFVFERAAVPAAAVPRQALSTRDVRRAGRRYARLQYPRQHARLHRGDHGAVLRPHGRRAANGRLPNLPAGRYSAATLASAAQRAARSRTAHRRRCERSDASKSASRAPCVPHHSQDGRTHGTTERRRAMLAVRVPGRYAGAGAEIGSSRSICAR